MIEDVVRFPAKLELHGFSNGDILLQREIELPPIPAQSHSVSRSISEGIERGVKKHQVRTIRWETWDRRSDRRTSLGRCAGPEPMFA